MKKKLFSNLSANQLITYVAVLSAIGVVLNYIEIIYPPVPYLKFDISEIVVLLATMISLPAAITVALVKGLLLFLLKGSDPIGIYSLIMGSFVLAISYYIGNKVFRNFSETKKEILSLIFMAILFVVMMIANNYFIVYPAYTPGQNLSDLISTDKYFSTIMSTYFLYNVIKATIISVTYFLVQKTIKKNLS